MNFQEVLAPYQEIDEGGREVRTYEAYLKWLTGPKYGIPKEFVEKAILMTFAELEQGAAFEGTEEFSAGHHLDVYIRDTALRLRDEWAKDEAVKMEGFFNNLLQAHKDKAVQEVIDQMNKPKNLVQRAAKKVFRL